MAEGPKKFLCGVIEGFYGRPWTFEQRIDLFGKMASWGMDTFLYAPKDDEKHRNEWRELYSLEEADKLSQLIKACEDSGIKFVYAIAPGLDIVFSSEREVEALKMKLDQVVHLGCKSFSILFDDIEPELCHLDAKVFSSFAQAHVSLANDIYHYLKKPGIFLFCPTEYCGSRAVPSVKESHYLSHVGRHLHPDIDVLWTGPKVISRTIPLASIVEVAVVLKRKPLIWDNLHANDYDQRRLFLGPYVGRSPSLIPHLAGVLTNPNCEYTVNFVAIHTLAQWSKCSTKRTSQDTTDEEDLSCSTDDEVEYMQSTMCSSSSSERGSSPEQDQDVESDLVYNPRRALDRALSEWLKEFGKLQKREKALRMELSAKFSNDALSEPPPLMGPPIGVGDSATERSSVVSTITDDESDSPMELACDGQGGNPGRGELHSCAEHIEKPDKCRFGPFTQDDLYVLVDFFYLPHKYGPLGVKVLQSFNWVKGNAPSQEALQKHSHVFEEVKEDLGRLDEFQGDVDPKVLAWYKKAHLFRNKCKEICQMFARLTAVPNRPLLYDIYQYMWDAKEAVMLLDSYVTWLVAGGGEDRDDTWLPPDCEPFVLRGGITAAMQRLLPQLSGEDYCFHRKAPRPSPLIYTIRPYRPEDKEMAYLTCLQTGDNGADGTHLFKTYPDILGDRFVGPYTSFSPSLSFILEDDIGVCGYVLAALDSRSFYDQFHTEWAPEVAKNYPLPHVGIKELTPEEELAWSLHNPKFFLPANMFERYPSHLHIDLMARAQGKGVGSRMIRTILSALKAKGSRGVHLEMSASNTRALKFYLKFGFTVQEFDSDDEAGEPPEDTLIMARTL